jgi:hypothetical protein
MWFLSTFLPAWILIDCHGPQGFTLANFERIVNNSLLSQKGLMARRSPIGT